MGADKVQLYVYDLTRGMASQLSPILLGKRIEGVWHTSIVVGNVEHFFGYGVQQAVPGSTPFGLPLKVIDLGFTEISADMRQELLAEMSGRFQPQHYSLLNHNCNHFSHELAQLLVGEGIPERILNQAKEVLDTPMGQMLMPMLLQMEGQMGNATAGGFNTAGAAGGAFGRTSGGNMYGSSPRGNTFGAGSTNQSSSHAYNNSRFGAGPSNQAGSSNGSAPFYSTTTSKTETSAPPRDGAPATTTTTAITTTTSTSGTPAVARASASAGPLPAPASGPASATSAATSQPSATAEPALVQTPVPGALPGGLPTSAVINGATIHVTPVDYDKVAAEESMRARAAAAAAALARAASPTV